MRKAISDLQPSFTDKSETINIDIKAGNGLNRRQFLQQIGVKTGAGLLVTQSVTTALAATAMPQNKGAALIKDELPISLNHDRVVSAAQPPLSSPLSPHCMIPSIETRLFSSSNGTDNIARSELALARLACAGFKVSNPAIVNRHYLRFAGTDGQRASDLQNIATGAIAAPKLLLGVRGGYGAMRLLPMIDWQTLGRIMQEHGTILAGFSDVTAIQCALLAKGGMSSLAAPMLYSEFGKSVPDEVSCRQFVEALTNPSLMIEVSSAHLTSKHLPTILATNEAKTLNGTIWGGNLSVVSALAGSDYLPRIEGGIVFLEEVGEQPYRIERMLYDLYLAGVFKAQQAIILGALSGTGEDSYDARYDVATVIRQLHKLTGLPIYSGMSFGHIANKQSFPLGARCQISPSSSISTASAYRLTFTDYPTLDASKIQTERLWQGV